MRMKIYGKGCAKCELLADNAESAAKSLGIPYEIEKVTDINAIIEAGIMRTPALALDDEVVVEGTVASEETIKALLS